MNTLGGRAFVQVDDRCAHCDSPKGDLICTACADEERELDIRGWLLRAKTVSPGLTDAEIAVVERLIADLELP